MRISVGDVRIEESDRTRVSGVLDSGRLSEGRMVREFEDRFAEYVGARYCVATSSGTGALITGLESLKHMNNALLPGDSIVTTSLTYVATANAIVLTGFKPVFADVDRLTFVITPDSVAAAINTADSPPRAVLPVHLMGYPSKVDELLRLRDSTDIEYVMEDACQAHGTWMGRKNAGTMGTLGFFSFYIAHNIQVGEMGAIVTDDSDVASLARSIKANGRVCTCRMCTRSTGTCPHSDRPYDPRFTHIRIGYNFKTTEIQAALALGQMERADRIREQRLRNVSYLNDRLSDLQDLLALPPFSEDVSYMAYPLVLKSSEMSRATVCQRLANMGVESRPLFGCIPTQQPSYRAYADKYHNRLGNAEYLGARGLYVGCHQYLTLEDLEYLCYAIRSVITSMM